jgi:4'-phosphopantetheinyl transferase
MEWLPREESQQPWALERGEVHVYRLALDSHEPLAADRFALLNGGERARSERLLTDLRRLEFTATRAALRRILGTHLGLPPANLSFVAAENGKPQLEPAHADLRFSVAHSGGRALIAVARDVTLGVDVEQVRDNVDVRGVAHRFFAERDWRMLDALPPDQQRPGFFRCWSRKEAMIKASGSTIAIGLDSEVPGQWWLHDLEPWDGYAAALAADAPGLVVRTWSIAT